MLAIYELGVWALGSSGLRNGADVWLREFLLQLGFRHFFLLPLLTCGVLLGWHHLRREPWRVDGMVLYGMLLESLALGGVLLLLASAQQSLLAVGTSGDKTRYLIAYCGAGIYEEMLFRLLLVSAVAGAARLLGANRIVSLVGAVAAASLLFAAAHYQFELTIGDWRWPVQSGEPFAWTSFWFRAGAGAFFAGLFLYRGFGVAAGTHALYDILATLA
jgi:hypothetical protein